MSKIQANGTVYATENPSSKPNSLERDPPIGERHDAKPFLDFQSLSDYFIGQGAPCYNQRAEYGTVIGVFLPTRCDRPSHPKVRLGKIRGSIGLREVSTSSGILTKSWSCWSIQLLSLLFNPDSEVIFMSRRLLPCLLLIVIAPCIAVAQECAKIRHDYFKNPTGKYSPDDPWTRSRIWWRHTGHFGKFYNCDCEEQKRYSPYICWKNADCPWVGEGLLYQWRRDRSRIRQRIADGSCVPRMHRQMPVRKM